MSAPLGLVLLVTLVVTTAVVALLLRHGKEVLLDTPNARSSHVTPTPRGGGLGIWIGLLAGVMMWRVVGANEASLPGWPVMLVIGIVTFVSFLDDLYSLPYRLRLLVQVAATVMLLWLVGPFEVVAIPLLGHYWVPLSGLLISVFWCIALTNAYNFLDGIDGLAGAQGLIGGVAWGVLGISIGQPTIAWLGFIIAVACAAFLCFNWSPARIFMGDVGSATLGMLFAALPLLTSALAQRPAWAAPAGALIVWPFLFDAGVTIIRRLGRGENIFEGHRSHFYQRLVIAGWSHRRTARLYAVLAVGTGAGAFALVSESTLGDVLAWISIAVTSTALPLLVWQAERQRGSGLSSGITPLPGVSSSAT